MLLSQSFDPVSRYTTFIARLHEPPPHAHCNAYVHCALSTPTTMGFLAKISTLALAASVSVAAQDVDLDSINKSVDKELSQVDTNGN